MMSSLQYQDGQTQWLGCFDQWLGYCPEGRVKHLTQLLVENELNRWVRPYFTQYWIVFNPAFFSVGNNLWVDLIYCVIF